MKVAISVLVEPETKLKLAELAKREKRTVSQLVKNLCEKLIEEDEKNERI